MADASPSPSIDTLAQLVRGLERRHLLDDPQERYDLDVALHELADAVARELEQPVRTATELVPPRRIGVAMVLALHSQPHFAVTLPQPARDGTVEPGELERRAPHAPIIATNEAIEKSLGLTEWEVDELREEVDRRAGTVLKQVRTVNWMWSYFGFPASGAATLGRVLFPGVEERSVDLVRRGGHLYLLMDMELMPPPLALYLPWLAPDSSFSPTSFRSKGVDLGLRNRLARGIGADDDEVAELLDSMVSLLPRRDAGHFLHLDQWRSHGRAVVTDLGTPYVAGEWLLREIPDDGADWRAWLRLDDQGQLMTKGAVDKLFDALALPRVAAMVRLLYAAMLASVDREGREGVDQADDLDLYDVPRHMRAVLQPLLSWAGRATTHKTIARELGVRQKEVAALLEGVRRTWIDQAASSWYGPPGTRAPSIQTLVLQHLIGLHRSIRGMMARDPDPRWEHGDMLLLFVAHYLREARLERLWIRQLSDCVEDSQSKLPPPEDVAGHWFWRAFQRLLDAVEQEQGPLY